MATVGQVAEQASGMAWYDVREWGVEGKGWEETTAFFDRLPARAKSLVREPVWELSRHSAGMCTHFATDAEAITARWSLVSPALAMPHMPATGVSGLDLYAEDGGGRWRWLGVGRPETGPDVEAILVSGLPKGMRRYRLYLPLYNGVCSVQVGVPPGSRFEGIAPRREGPVVFYGTSIVQGGCASRPGMAHAAILGRRLDRPVINLGFSGNGIMEPEVAALLAELPASVFVVDCLPNMDAEGVSERAGPLVMVLRRSQPDAHIVLVEDRTYSHAPFLPALQERHEASRVALRRTYQDLLASGIGRLAYVPGAALLGDDGEDTVDGSHPTDLGFQRMADALEPFLRPLC